MTALPVNISSTYAGSAADPSVDLHQQHHDIIHEAVNNQVSKGELLFNLRDQPGVVGDGRADDSLALQAALDAAVALGARAFARGTFRTSQTLRITGNADLGDATIRYHGNGVAILVGVSSGYIMRRAVRLPGVIAAAKTVRGWGQVSGSVGVLVQNCYNLDLTVPHVQGFGTGLLIAGQGGGVSYCNVVLGHLDNNRTNLRFSADSAGWANQNNFFGGRLSHNSEEGVEVSGTRHVLIDSTASKVNNNTMWGASLESPNVVEYHLDCGGNDNYFMSCRWENTGTGARVIWRAKSTGNVVSHGFGSHLIVETREPGTSNQLVTRAKSRLVGDGGSSARSAVLTVENASSSALPALRVMGAGAQAAAADENLAWAVDISAAKIRGKRTTDSHERIVADNVNGRLYLGEGSAAVTRYLGVVGQGLAFDGASVGFVTDNAYDIGMPSRRPRYVRAATGVQTGAFATSARPAPSTAGIGTCIFDSTLRRPVWSTGTRWVDANGRVV